MLVEYPGVAPLQCAPSRSKTGKQYISETTKREPFIRCQEVYAQVDIHRSILDNPPPKTTAFRNLVSRRRRLRPLARLQNSKIFLRFPRIFPRMVPAMMKNTSADDTGHAHKSGQRQMRQRVVLAAHKQWSQFSRGNLRNFFLAQASSLAKGVGTREKDPSSFHVIRPPQRVRSSPLQGATCVTKKSP